MAHLRGTGNLGRLPLTNACVGEERSIVTKCSSRFAPMDDGDFLPPRISRYSATERKSGDQFSMVQSWARS